MAVIEAPVKMKRGAKTKLAKRFKVSLQHVSQVAMGKREGRENLVSAILREADNAKLKNVA